MTNKELSAAIRAELKKAGYTPKDFSIRCRYSLYDQAADIKIKKPTVDRREIKKLVLKFQEVYWDEHTGEILAGGNTYIHVEYAYDVFDEVAAEGEQAAAKILESITDKIITLRDGLYIFKDGGRFTLTQQNKDEHCTFYIYNAFGLSKLLFKFDTFGSIAA